MTLWSKSSPPRLLSPLVAKTSITPSPIARTLDDIKESVIAIYKIIRAISMVAFGALFLYAIYKITYTDDANILAKQKALAWDWAKAFAFSYISRLTPFKTI